MTIETGQVMRYDIFVLESGTRAGTVRSRFEIVETTDPVTLIRRQGIGSVTWHRVGFEQLYDAVVDADDDAPIATLLRLDALNEVPIVPTSALTGDEPSYGVVMIGDGVVGFSEGPMTTGEPTGPRRGPEPAPSAPRTSVEAPPARDTRMEPSTFGAYPVIEAPITVDAGSTFDVEIGVDDDKMRHTVTEGISVGDLDPYVQTVTLKVLLSAPGFEQLDDAGELPELKIDRTSLDHAPVVIGLRSVNPPETYDPAVGVWTARLTATFYYDGAIVGEGYREIRVNETHQRHLTIESDRAPVLEVSSASPAAEDTDITITITHEDGTGNFNVRVSSPHLIEPVPPGHLILGQDANSFTAVLIREVESAFNDSVSDEVLGYVGERIAGKMPAQVVDALLRVWRSTAGPDVDPAERRIPDVLLLTDEWAVPWELMHIEADGSAPPFLGAQFNVGRWPYQYRHTLDSARLGISGLCVMIGHYSQQAARRLERAEEEAEELEATYNARSVDAGPDNLDQLLTGILKGGFAFEALHFAGHGRSDPKEGTYLTYSDGRRMSVFALGGAQVAREKHAFVFVNACQVGTAEEMLGEYAGLAGTAIHAGFRGFVAPLWSVLDGQAKEVSIGLYAASAEGRAVSEYLREVRRKFYQTDTDPAHTTYMAYVLYGHPRLRLGGPEPKR